MALFSCEPASRFGDQGGEILSMAGNRNGILSEKLSYPTNLESEAVFEARSLVSELCRQFYTLGWVSGTGGSITVKAHDASVPKSNQIIVMSPSGVQKERMVAKDMYLLSADGKILSAPEPKVYPHKPPKCTDCCSIFMEIYQKRNAGAIIHSHGMESCMATMIHPSSKEFRITHMEMIKGIQGHGYHDELVVPIIENTAHESELTEFISEALAAYPKTTAVLVRNHGIYVWGETWISAKTQAECYHYLFEAALKMCQMGLDWSTPNHALLCDSGLSGKHVANPSKAFIVLDIEGTTTPISFVTGVLFPYAQNNVRKHLTCTYDTNETQNDIKLLRIQVQSDLDNNIANSVPIPSAGAGKDSVTEALVKNVEAMIKADRKITALKQLQGHIWRTGYKNGELNGQVFDDVPDALRMWHARGIKVYIYSSGSREAQRLIFGNTIHGDLRKYLSGYFDTFIGNKKEAKSYFEISQSLGVDEPSQVLFVTDIYEEAVAASQAGLDVVISIRPGNLPLPENHGFKTIKSFADI